MAKLFTYDILKQYTCDLLEYTQILEEELRWAYAYLHKGNTEKNYKKSTKFKTKTLVNKTEALDLGRYEHRLTIEQYENLRKISDIREFITSKMFISFINNENFERSLEYKDACTLIDKYRTIYSELIQPTKVLRQTIEELTKRCASM